jgi:rhodanese-related sulfurtransferase
MIEGGAGLVVIDTRTNNEYTRGRIPRSLLIPEEKFFALELLLPPAKDTPLVFY